ncbi:EAL domain-containing response regulator [Simiduia aestuariiviva]|uniref:Diguanylate cyclase (GGDEF)-like protein/PAS domain S-box-containing protein n=1 Tax=Simiduia aestuariiviva TaxID=1510459 RepID=A0A839UG42_9GAMM|nr:EAL domain-containing protein [Simiduia aestuariiviva]MBB3167014.1 diguanylate cyclase (GGDEF)-like protein/PAS domain S-box-containing protein [Simiduia aestuariiviva]
MNPNDTIRLLIINDSRSEAERLISMLNNAGRNTRAQHVDSEEGLIKLLQEHTWDLAIGQADSEQLPAATAVRQIKRLNKDIPVILQTEEEGSHAIVDGLRLGAVEVVRMDEDQHLLLVVTRELENREHRQARRKADRKFKEAERRSQQLLDSSRDAVAYVQDGMFLYVNQSFSERFGYEDPDDVLCMPTIDLVAAGDRDRTKQFLKEFTLKGEEAESTELDFNSLHHSGKQQPIKMEVVHAIFDEEPCIQLVMRASAANNEELEAQLEEIKQTDVQTGLYNRQFFLERLEMAVDKAADGEAGATLTYIEADQFFDRVESAHGVSVADGTIKKLAQTIQKHARDGEYLARFSDDTFALLSPGTSADKHVQRAKKLCAEVAETIFDIDGTTVQFTITAGLALVTEASKDAETIIDQALQAIEEVRKKGTEGSGSDAKLFEPKIGDAEAGTDVARALQRAVDNNQFKLLFQPIISLRGNENELYEVLLRMVDEEGNEIEPAKFLEAAETIGATTKIDRWVILESIKMLSEHRAKGNKTSLVVNLSRHSITDESLVPWLGVAFKAAKLPADAMMFQVREIDITNHMTAAKALCAGLDKLKTHLSISGFGCAMNHFNTLKHVPAHYIKVDGSFTQDVQTGGEGAEALTNLIKELHKLEKITVVPFVENANVLSTLWQSGVHYIQGHYLQGPSEGMDYDFSMDG